MVKKLISFDCGCKWYAYTDDNGNIISVDYNPLDAPLGCKKTWNMVGDGLSLGVFQLETSWGQSIARKVKPRNIDEFSQLIAIMRPGTSDAVVDGKTLTNHYIDRKFEREESIPLVPELKNITADTYHILCFQEQIMKASQELAGFTGIEARELQKAIGKKKPEVMAAIKTKFVQGCINHSRMDRESAERVFDVIEANQRYSFNKCLASNCVLERVDGSFITIELCNVGDFIKDHLGNYTKILNKFENGIRDLYEITLDNGKTISCTLDHKFLCEDGKIYPLHYIINNDISIVTE